MSDQPYTVVSATYTPAGTAGMLIKHPSPPGLDIDLDLAVWSPTARLRTIHALLTGTDAQTWQHLGPGELVRIDGHPAPVQHLRGGGRTLIEISRMKSGHEPFSSAEPDAA